MIPPQSVLALIRLREGIRNTIYADSLSNLTGGIGHLLTPEQKLIYKAGDVIREDVIQNWFEQDTTIAYNAGATQASIIGMPDNQLLINAFACVSFQEGAHWPKRFPTLWILLEHHKWEEAAMAAEGTRWAKQTPVRIKDFTDALRAIASLEPTSTPTEAEVSEGNAFVRNIAESG